MALLSATDAGRPDKCSARRAGEAQHADRSRQHLAGRLIWSRAMSLIGSFVFTAPSHFVILSFLHSRQGAATLPRASAPPPYGGCA
eukprot:scaffold9338_cov113-Isochrysis_galbana.AAC.7